jgi:hypothetical protein
MGTLRADPYMTEEGGLMFTSDKNCEDTAVYTIPSTEILVTTEFIENYNIKESVCIDSFRGIHSIPWEILLSVLNPTKAELRQLVHLSNIHKETNVFVRNKKIARGVLNYEHAIKEDIHVNKDTGHVTKADNFTLRRVKLIEQCERSLRPIKRYFELLNCCLSYDDSWFRGDNRRRDLRNFVCHLIRMFGENDLFLDILEHTDYNYYVSLTTKQRRLYVLNYIKNALEQLLTLHPVEEFIDLQEKYENLIKRIQELD